MKILYVAADQRVPGTTGGAARRGPGTAEPHAHEQSSLKLPY